MALDLCSDDAEKIVSGNQYEHFAIVAAPPCRFALVAAVERMAAFLKPA
jgi:hypothetical protein